MLTTAPNSGIPAGKRPTAADLDEILRAEPKTLYVNRRLSNAADLIAWARAAGFKKTLSPDDIHVTVAFSKTPLAWPSEDDEGIAIDGGGPRSIGKLGDQGAVVLRFKSSQLEARWRQFCDAGASWDYPSYKPHVTFTMVDDDHDFSKIEPYDGPLEFGPEEFSEIGTRGDDWAAKAKASLIGDADFNESDHPRDQGGKFGSGGGGGGGSASVASGEGGSGSAARASKVKAHVEAIKKHAAAAHEFIKDKSAGEVLASVAANEKLRHKAKEALSFSLQSLLSHATGLDQSTWKLNEEFIDHTVGHFADIAAITTLQAKDVMRKGVQALIAMRSKQAEARMAGDEDDGVAAVLAALLDLLGDGDDGEFKFKNGDPEPGKAARKPGDLKADGQDGATGERPGAAIAATDSALRMALDRDSVRDKDRDGRLIVAKTNISKATVNPYRGEEIPDWQALGLDPNHVYHLFRDPDELAKAAKSFNGVQLLRKHTPVSAADDQRWEVVGTTGTDAEFEAPYLRNSLHVWAQEAIDDIESDAKKELSCGYHYRADMTPGDFEGAHYDGVMRDICGNHVALVKDGRAGADVVVGDSIEGLHMSTANNSLAKQLLAHSARQTSVYALTAYLRPRLAMDAQIPMAKVFEGVTGRAFKEQKPVIAKRIRDLAKDKLAKDASLDDVEKVLDMLDGHEVDGGDESVSEPQHKAMEAAAAGHSTLAIPEKVGKEFADADKGKTFDEEGFRGFLKEKGMGEDDISAAMGMLPKKTGMDAERESEEDKKKREEKEKAEKDKSAADAKAAKDAEMKDMVTKPAMDAAIAAASDATAKRVRAEERAVREALTDVRPYVGELAMAFDSAEEVYRHSLGLLGVPEAKAIHSSALKTILTMQRKPGEQARESSNAIAMDSASVKSFNERYPDAARIGRA